MTSTDYNPIALDGMQQIVDLMDQYGVTCTLKEFLEIVNVTYHRYECEVYDVVHKCMWESLPPVFEALANSAAHPLRSRSGISLLDVGFGTGLSSTLLLKTHL